MGTKYCSGIGFWIKRGGVVTAGGAEGGGAGDGGGAGAGGVGAGNGAQEAMEASAAAAPPAARIVKNRRLGMPTHSALYHSASTCCSFRPSNPLMVVLLTSTFHPSAPAPLYIT